VLGRTSRSVAARFHEKFTSSQPASNLETVISAQVVTRTAKPARFTVKSVPTADIAVLYCQGSLGCDEAIILSGAAMPLVRQKRAVIINFDGVERMDSGGLATLILLHMYASSCGGALRFCNLGRPVQELLEVTCVDTLFDVYATEEQACGTAATALARE
jgi:anti-anti-sigma factor